MSVKDVDIIKELINREELQDIPVATVALVAYATLDIRRQLENKEKDNDDSSDRCGHHNV